VKRVVSDLKAQKYLALGGMSLKMPTTTADVDQWQKLFGISYEALDQSECSKGRLQWWSGAVSLVKVSIRYSTHASRGSEAHTGARQH